MLAELTNRMENLKLFLDTSTIHGLFHISNTRKNYKLFWILVVIAGFSGAGYMIYQSFDAWDQSPIKTTIETRPINEMNKFPRITVCPPNGTYTDLNYDLKMIENMTLDEDAKRNLTQYGAQILADYLFEKLENLETLKEIDRNYNWYYGNTKIELPSISIKRKDVDKDEWYFELKHQISTNATSGTILAPQKFESRWIRTWKYNVNNIPSGQSSAKLPVILSLGHSVTRSLGHLVTQSYDHYFQHGYELTN